MNPLNPNLPSWIWLASKSPRRKELIESLGLQAKVFLFKTGHEAEALEEPFEGEDPLLYVERVTRLKMQEALKALSECKEHRSTAGIILTADTTVALEGKILGKPQDAQEARAMLTALSNTAHQVHTAVAVGVLNQREPVASPEVLGLVQTSEVEFGAIPPTFMERYIQSGEPFDKAGGYGIQGTAGQFVRHISGSHSGIMGLPVYETGLLLEKAHSLLATPILRNP